MGEIRRYYYVYNYSIIQLSKKFNAPESIIIEAIK